MTLSLSELRALAEKAKAEFDALLAADFSPPGAHADNHFKMHDLVLALPALLDERDRLAARVERLEAVAEAAAEFEDESVGIRRYFASKGWTDTLAAFDEMVAAIAAAKKED